jgi:methionyl-tRNA formyltransferase
MPGSRKLRIVLIGEESAGLQLLKAIAGTDHQIVAVMTSSASNGANGSTPLAIFAQNMGYPIWPPKLVKDPEFAQKANAAQIDIILNVHSLYIIHEKVLQAALIGAFNTHPGPLPRYAGLNTVSWAIYQGENTYGATVHWMVPKIDAGDIAYQSMFPIHENDTPLSLTHKCVRAIIPLVFRLLETASVNSDAIPKIQQELSTRQYFGRKIPEGGCLSWLRPACKIVDFVRACDYCPYPSPWGHPKALWADREIAIIKAARTHIRSQCLPGTVGRSDDGGVFVASADEWVSVRQLKIDGQYVRPQAILKPGDRLHSRPVQEDAEGPALPRAQAALLRDK